MFADNPVETMKKRLEQQLWAVLKEHLDAVRAEKSSMASVNRGNAVNVCLGWLTTLAHVLQRRGLVLPPSTPSFVRLPDSLAESTLLQNLSPEVRASCTAFLLLRIGDIFRYKEDLEECSRWYALSVEERAEWGEAWNSRGLVSLRRGQLLCAASEHARALHTAVPFAAASANLLSLLHKHSNPTSCVSFESTLLAVGSLLQQLRAVGEANVRLLGDRLTEELSRGKVTGESLARAACVLVAVTEGLGDAQDELRAIQERDALLEELARRLGLSLSQKWTPSLLSALWLLLRVSPSTRLTLEELDERIDDVELPEIFAYWKTFGPWSQLSLFPAEGSQLRAALSPLADSAQSSAPRRRRTLLRDRLRRRFNKGMAAWSSWGAWLSPRQMFERASKVPAPDLVLFLKNVLLADEPIFASLGLPDSVELSSLLTDLVVDAQSCGASWVARGDVEGDSRAIVGVCLASAHSLIERQTDRIFSYDFREPKLHTAVEFVKFVLNKMDLDFFLSEASISRPVFVALLAVHRGHRRRGLARRLLDHSLKAARDEGHNGAVALSSSFASRCLLRASFPSTICRVRYKDYRGEERTPPIQPRGERDDELNVLLAPLSS